MRDERQWIPVEVIWDREPRGAQPSPRGFPWPQAVAPAPTERPRPTRLAAPHRSAAPRATTSQRPAAARARGNGAATSRASMARKTITETGK